jgi:hypothetical protein
MLLEPLANMMVALDKQFLELPVEVLILGDGAQIDPVTNQPISGSREALDGYDLVANYAARAMGATMGLSKGMKQQNLIQLLTAMASPLGQAAMGQINAVNFFRGIFREFEVPNINEIFVTNPQLAMLQQQLTQGGGGGLGSIPSSGQVMSGGASVLSGLPGAAQGSAQGLMMPPNIGNNMAPVGA